MDVKTLSFFKVPRWWRVGKITATWFVVPQSGTDELSGLRGDGGFEGDFGKGSVGTLAYWFEAPRGP